MKDKLRRNDPCHCGSGKKLKSCHGQIDEKSTQYRVIGVIVVMLLFWFFFFKSESPAPVSTYSNSPFVPQTQSRPSVPSETNPPGKIWSQEHNHWHDAPSTSPSLPNIQSVIEPESQPPGVAPEGKVWSQEHNHWHNNP